MIDTLLSVLAPHLCCSCGRIGAPLCDNCKYDIISEPFVQCVGCLRPSLAGVSCKTCRLPGERTWCVGARHEALEILINRLKFQRVKAAARPLASLLAVTIDQLPPDTVVVAVPTVASHVRERGYDHMQLVAKHLARQRDWRVRQVLRRQTNTRQRGVSAALRERQAKEAFSLPRSLPPDVPYLLIDDVMTTGATIKYAVAALQQAGARQVYVAIIARQTLD